MWFIKICVAWPVLIVKGRAGGIKENSFRFCQGLTMKSGAVILDLSVRIMSNVLARN